MSLRLALLGSLLFALGCAGPSRTLKEGKYANTYYELTVSPGQPTTQGPLGDDWLVDNFYLDGPDWEPKHGGDYEVFYEVDTDNDGRIDQGEKTYRYELRLRHKLHDGVITLQMLPLSDEDSQKRLDVLMQRWIAGISGGTYRFTSLGGEDRIVEKRYAASLESATPAQLAGLQAYGGTVQVTNVDQALAADSVQGDRVEIFLAHTLSRVRMGGSSGQVRDFRVLLVALYSNRADRFAAGLDDFHAFLNAIALDGRAGFRSGN